MAAIKAFREPYLLATLHDPGDFEDWDARRVRYAILWGFYENTAYAQSHNWSQAYRAKYGLYRYVRGIYNPANRIVGFCRDHVWGGALDREAQAEGALPILTDNEALRPAIAQLWRWANWNTRKDLVTLYGAALGDSAIRVVDDVTHGKVYMDVVNPGTLEDVTLDDYGNVKGYTITETRKDPRGSGRDVSYQEVASRDGDSVVYQTFLDGAPYAWNGEAAEWAVAYGFVPLVVVKHIDVGLKWGWSELHAGRGKFSEVDDVASKLNDQIRKLVDAPWFFTGMKGPETTPKPTSAHNATTDPLIGRQEMPAFYSSNDNAKATALVAPLDIAATSATIREMLAELERDYPELRLSVAQAAGEVSGRALRTARQPVETKIAQRRGVYDNALVRAQQMAVAIAGWRGLPDFRGFGLDSYEAGALDHQIGTRPVFEEDPIDGAEIDRAFWESAKLAIDAGVPLPVYLDLQGWDADRIESITGSEEYQTKQDMVRNMASLGRGAAEGVGGSPVAEDDDDAETDEVAGE